MKKVKFESLLKLKQTALFNLLVNMFSGNVHSVPGEFLIVPGSAPVLLVAHLDTVHRETVRRIIKTEKGNVWNSPEGIGGDDRCGVHALLTVYGSADKKPWLLFTCDEEIGAIGAQRFCQDHADGILPPEIDGLKYIIEIDRKGRNDSVYYDCANGDFEKYVNSHGFETQYGSFSDISYIAPELGIAAVNLSSGYYSPHTIAEYINIRELNETISKVALMVQESVSADVPRYEYIERKRLPSYWEWEDDRYKFENYNESSRAFDSEKTRYLYEELLSLYSPADLDRILDEYGEIAIEIVYNLEFCSD